MYFRTHLPSVTPPQQHAHNNCMHKPQSLVLLTFSPGGGAFDARRCWLVVGVLARWGATPGKVTTLLRAESFSLAAGPTATDSTEAVVSEQNLVRDWVKSLQDHEKNGPLVSSSSGGQVTTGLFQERSKHSTEVGLTC